MRRGLFVDRRLAEAVQGRPLPEIGQMGWVPQASYWCPDLLVEDGARQGASDRADGGSRGAEGIEW